MAERWSATISCDEATPPAGVVDWSRSRGWPKEAPSHPTVVSVQTYWRERAGDAPAPPREAIDPAQLGGLLAHVSLMDVTGPPLDFRLRLMGNVIATWVGYRLEGQYLGDWGLDPDQEAGMRAIYHQICDTLQPICMAGELPAAERIVSFEALHLPLVDDANRPTAILAVMGFWDPPATASPPGTGFLGP